MAKTRINFDLTGRKGMAYVPPVLPQAKPEEPAPEKRLVGEWAVLKGHCPVTFARKKKAQRRPPMRGDRHRGPDIRVVRQHMRDTWRTDFDVAGDTPVTEAEYDEAVRSTYAIGASGCIPRCSEHEDCRTNTQMAIDCLAKSKGEPEAKNQVAPPPAPEPDTEPQAAAAEEMTS